MTEPVFERKRRKNKMKKRNPVAREMHENRHYRHRVDQIKRKDYDLSKKELEELIREMEHERIQDETVGEDIQ